MSLGRAFDPAVGGMAGNAFQRIQSMEIMFNLIDLFKHNENGFFVLPTPHNDYPQYTTSSGMTPAGDNTAVGFVTDRSRKGKLENLLVNSEFLDQTGWGRASKTVIEDGKAKCISNGTLLGSVVQSVLIPANSFLTFSVDIRPNPNQARVIIRDNALTETLFGQNFSSTNVIKSILYAKNYTSLRFDARCNVITDLARSDFDFFRASRIAGKHLYQPIADNCPTLVSDEGEWSWRFDGVNDRFIVPGLMLSQPYTLIWAVNINNTISTQTIIDRNGTSQAALRYSGTDGNFQLAYNGNTINAPGSIVAGKYIVSAVIDGANSRIRVNQGDWGLGNAGTSGFTSGALIGAQWDQTGGFWGDKVYAGIVRSGVLNDTQISKSENELNALIGLGLGKMIRPFSDEDGDILTNEDEYWLIK